MLHYINIEKKKLVGRNNQPNTLPIVIDYSTVEDLSFQFINNQNQIQPISGLSGLYIAGSLGIGQPSYDLLFLSKDYTIENDVLTFSVDTYTRNYLDKIKKKNTEINLEIGQISLDVKKLLLRDYALACPRVYVEGLTPQQIDSHDYWTIEETQEAIDNAIEGISGFVTEEQFEEGLSTKQDVIDADNKLDYALISGTPTIPTKTSDLTNDSDFQTGTDVQTALNVKQDVIDANNKLAYDLLSGTPSIPTKTSDLQNDSGFITDSSLQGLASETYVDNAVSGKADTSALTAHTSDTTIHVTSADKTSWDGKQDAITSDNKLDYSLLSSTPTIPTKTSDLQNDSGFITDSSLQGLASETYVDDAVSGKIDNPSGGTEGQVLTKTANGEEWADSQGGDAKDVTVEDKTLSSSVYVVDFLNGKQIQKYGISDAASNDIEISIADNLGSLPSGVAPTIELQIPVLSDVSSVILPQDVQVIDMPNTLSGAGVSATYRYHDIVFRAQKDCNDIWRTYANYSYAFNEFGLQPIIPSDYVFYASLSSANALSAETGQELIYRSNTLNAETIDGITAVHFTGDSDEGIYTQDMTNLPSGNHDFTMCCWIRSNGASNNRDILSFGSTNALHVAFLGTFGTDKFKYGYWDFDKDDGVNDGNWHFVLQKNENSVLKTYLDGIKMNEYPQYADIHTDYNGKICIGAYYSGSRWETVFTGHIAAVRIYGRSLSNSEIQALASEFTPTT